MENNTKKVCILGYGVNVPEKNLKLSRIAARELSKAGITVVTGNLEGTFNEALSAAKSENGKTMVILSEDIKPKSTNLYDDIIRVKTSNDKHNKIAEVCDAAVVIGGGPGTKSLIEQMKKRGVKIVSIAGSGGAADEIIVDNGYKTDRPEDGVNWLLDKL